MTVHIVAHTLLTLGGLLILCVVSKMPTPQWAKIAWSVVGASFICSGIIGFTLMFGGIPTGWYVLCGNLRIACFGAIVGVGVVLFFSGTHRDLRRGKKLTTS